MSRPLDPRLLRRAPAARRLVTALGALQVVAALLTVSQAALLAEVIVRIFQRRTGAVLPVLLVLVAVGAGRAALAGAQEWLTARASVRVRAQLRRATLEAIVRLGPAWTQRQPAGRLVNATGPGLDALDGYVVRALPALVSAAVVPGIVLVRITLADWQSGLILLLLLPLVPIFMGLVGVTTKRHVEHQYEVLGRLAGQFLDLLRGLTTLRIYGRAEAQEQTLRRATEEYRRQTLATLRVAFLSGLVLDLLAALSVAVVAVDVGLRLDAGHISFATALLVLILAPELFAPLRAVGAQHHASQEGSTAAAAALDIVAEAPEAVVSLTPAPVVPTGALTFDTTTITYPGRGDAALADICVTVESGAVVALTGPSGAGKSTAIAALLGFLTPATGSVLVGTRAGRVDLGELDATAWRESTAWLPQRPRPSQDTVGEEVLLGDPDASPEALVAACRACHTPAPSTALGEDGRLVSAGQRRRIALARVLLRVGAVRASGGVPIVLLDEPSEDLDHATEQVVAGVVSGLAGHATVVIATHSDELAELADVRIRFAAGRVVEQVPQVRRSVPCVAPLPSPDLPADAPLAPRPTTAPVGYRLRDLAREAAAGRRLGLAAVLSAAAALTGLGLTASSMWLISRAAQHPNVQALAVAVVGVRTFAIGRAVLRYAERLVTHDGALRLLATLRVRVFAALRPLPANVLGEYGRGDLLRRFVGDVDGAQEGLVRALVPASGAAAGGLGAVLIATALTPAAGIALAVGLLVSGLVVPAVSFRLAGNGSDSVRLSGRRDERSAAMLDALAELTAYGRASASVETVAALDVQVEATAERPALAAAVGTSGAGFAAAATLATVLAAAAAAVHSGALSVVNVGVLAVCVLTGFESVSALPAALVAWARCRAGLDRVSEVTSREAVLGRPAHAAAVPGAALGVRARGLSLAPAEDAALVLAGASLTLEPATRLAVVGPSGCGKSTLLAAALRLLPIAGGSLALTGGGRSAELRDLSPDNLPPAVAGSLQGDHVFDSTLRDNLRVVRPGASDTELDAIATRVGLLDFVGSLPQRWSTPAGPDGANISGGQRQRLLVGRALLADPRVLVLDEPTAHLDAETERIVLDDILAATAGRTVLLTTHRRLADDRVDAILRISEGRLVRDDVAHLPVGPQAHAVPDETLLPA